jgi:hypothetical protein
MPSIRRSKDRPGRHGVTENRSRVRTWVRGVNLSSVPWLDTPEGWTKEWNSRALRAAGCILWDVATRRGPRKSNLTFGYLHVAALI